MHDARTFIGIFSFTLSFVITFTFLLVNFLSPSVLVVLFISTRADYNENEKARRNRRGTPRGPV